MNGTEGQIGQSPLDNNPGPQGPSPQGEGGSGHASQRHDEGAGATDHRQDSDGGESGQSAEERRFTQADVDRIAADRARKAERRAEQRALRLLGNQSRQGQSQGPDREPQREQEKLTRQHFASDDDYIDYRVQQGLKAERQAREQSERQTAHDRIAERVSSAYQQAERLEGFDADEYDSLPLTPAITHAVLDAESATQGQLMLYLQQHPDEVSKISRMSPIQQAKAIGRIEAKLDATGSARESAGRQQQQPSRAPRPGTNVGGGTANQSTGDLSRSSMADYVRARTRQGAKWATR